MIIDIDKVDLTDSFLFIFFASCWLERNNEWNGNIDASEFDFRKKNCLWIELMNSFFPCVFVCWYSGARYSDSMHPAEREEAA